MSANFRRLEVLQVIMHIVPKARKGDAAAEPLQLSDAACKLQAGVREELQARMRLQLSSAGRQVSEDSSTESKVPGIIRNFLTTAGADFVATSRQLATALREVQTGLNSGGMLLVADCKLSGAPALLIVKFEQERGMRAQPTTDNGQNVFDMEYLRDLFLTSRSRVFKVGLFSRSGISNGVLGGWVADKQGASGKVAAFFLEDYLGCRHLEEPDEITKRYFDASFDWINQSVVNPSSRGRYAIAVMAELQNQNAQMSTDRFAEVNMDSDGDADSYASFLETRDVPKIFVKDKGLIAGRLERMQFNFTSGAVVYFPISALEDGSVDIEEIDDRQTQITLIGEAKEAKPRSARSRSSASEEQD
ncbi:nucleoid-associated protein [Paractinoplanes toevensis]|uniref:Nucleoid-associated protein n=1 Tax=Paractinoplanes toevensis TaxID=571911 RepID=A0A919W8U5_9ACTN|nr:nucleoid-associated protein [Actinoplanes toevensis]GIM95691.1 hypothetical protein Ato02nite_074840 [Actinoplanes toevensis]